MDGVFAEGMVGNGFGCFAFARFVGFDVAKTAGLNVQPVPMGDSRAAVATGVLVFAPSVALR